MATDVLPYALLIAPLSACFYANPAFDADSQAEGSASATSTTSTTSTTTATTTTATVGPTTGSTSAGTGGVSATGTTSTGAGTSASTGVDATTGTPPEPERLQHHIPGNCALPLWCYFLPDVWSGSPARVGSQACFQPATPPPYELTRVGYQVAASFGDLSDTRLQVHEGIDGAVGVLLHDLPVDPAMLGPGVHDFIPEPPLKISSPRFCVGLHGGHKDPPQGGLGLAADELSLVPGQAFYKAQDNGGCQVPDWKDVTSFNPTPKGTWCIDADVVPAR